MTPSAKMMGLLAASFLGLVMACEDTLNVYVGALLIFGVLGGVLALIFVVLAAVPLCCGAMKGAAKPIAAVSIVVGLLACILPLIGAPVASANAVSAICDSDSSDCYSGGCTDKEKEDLMEGFSAFGVIVAYTAGFGWLAMILGMVAASLGCCILCKCCKMKDEDGGAGGAPQTHVVGQVVQ